MTDWRLENVKLYKGARGRFQRKQYIQFSETWDHDHCIGCWAKFAEFERPDIQHEGYVNADTEWVCQSCFHDLKDEMGWVLDPS